MLTMARFFFHPFFATLDFCRLGDCDLEPMEVLCFDLFGDVDRRDETFSVLLFRFLQLLY